MGPDALKIELDRHFIGASSETLVMSYLLSKGKEVFTPVITQSRSDLIYLEGGTPVRVQVKTGTKSKAGNYSYEQIRLLNRGLYGSPEAYTEKDVDEIWVVGTHLWCFPISFAAGRTSLYLGTDNESPQTLRRTYNPDDFIVVRGEWNEPYRERAFR